MTGQAAAGEIGGDNYRFLQEHVYKSSGIVLENNKHYLFESRLTPLLKRHELASIRDLCALMEATSGAEIRREVTEAMTTNETYFFRDPAQYAAIRYTLLIRLREERRDARKLRFWSAAASTGQEAYSLAMILREDGLADWDVRILGTDLSSHVLERARGGRYQQIEVNRGLPAPLLVKYFRRSGIDWELAENIRKMVRFETVDLRRSMRSLGPFDLVFCRNVMIYFDTSTRKEMIRQLHGTLFRGGWLLLGGAETPSDYEQWFERTTVDGAAVYVAK